jgi:hypothetical protein
MDGPPFTVAIACDMQPADVVYLIVAVPLPIAVTSPEVPIVATATLLLLHAPPVALHEYADVAPGQRENVPVTAGVADTVITMLIAPHP